jgi:hypothetical protein
MKICPLMLGAYRLIIVITFWCISPFISMECPSSSHLINVVFSEISIETPACFQVCWPGKYSFSCSHQASAFFCG